MARTARSGLETRTSRLNLKPAKKPYRAGTGKDGIYLGYRRRKPSEGDANGTWVAIRYLGNRKYETERFAAADDFSESDGVSVLTYHEAMQKLGGELSEIQRRDRYTVKQAVADYLVKLKHEGKNPRDAEIRLNAYFLPFFDDKELSDLSPADFDNWLTWAIDHKPVGRGRKKVKSVIEASELKRRRRSTLNRTINTVLACLNRAFNAGVVSTDAAWRRVKKFKKADAARIQWLTIDQSLRLINACAPDFRRIVQAALLTGARWSELRGLRTRDYDSRSGTVHIAESKSGRARRIPLTSEGRRAFESWTAGHAERDYIFTDKNGNQWGSHDQHRPMKTACEIADIKPAIGIHALRHTYASSLVQAGVSLAIIAEAMGHSDTRMVSKHYGHLAPSHVADAIRAHLPTLGIETDGKVSRMRK
ncbi:MAG: site-specific integrase [Steroidobacter sp.]